MAKKKVEYKNFVEKSKVKDAAPSDGAVNRRWWLADKKDRASSAMSVLKYLIENDTNRLDQDATSCRLYGNVNILGINGISAARSNRQTSIKERVTYNVVQSAVDTITAKMAKNKPKPLFLTSGGDYKTQRKAKKLDKFVEGVFYENDAHTLGVEAFRDACVVGDGIIHVFEANGRIKLERVLPRELFVDWVEAYYGDPRSKHRVKTVDRDVLLETFPEHADKIKQVNAASAELVGEYQSTSDQILVGESWHLPSGPEAKDGLHILYIDSDDGELFGEEWKYDHYPFAKLPWTKPMDGYWAKGIAEQLQSKQLEINKILWVIQRSMHLMGTFKIWIKNGGKVVKEHLNNELGTVISSDEQPVYMTPTPVPTQYFERLQTIKDEAFQEVGVSMLSAASQKPAGLDSGKALREFNNIESDRFMVVGQVYEQFFMDLTRLAVETARKIYEKGGKLTAKVPGKKFIETIDWKDVDLDEDEYVMKIFPVSSLPNEPAGRLQTIQEYVQAGFLSPRSAKRLLDFPDLEQIEDLANAQEDWIHETLEKIIDDGDFTPPDPAMDIQLAKELVLQYYAQGQTGGLEEEKLEMLRNFNTQLDVLTQKAMPPPPPVAPGPGGAQAVPTAPPVSNMLPNAPGAAA